ncbi:MAG: SUMF1/EgtB/PvdO family nonheme iron enzyme [Sedimenticola sp.]
MAPDPIDPNDIEALKRRIAELETAHPESSGSIAMGERSTRVEGPNSGSINTGTQIVINYRAATDTPLSKEAIAQRISRYLLWLQDQTASIELRGIERAGGAAVVRLPLERAYVPLHVRPMPRIEDNPIPGGHQPSHNDLKEMDGADTNTRERDIALNQVLELDNHLVIIGGPGSGKTTVLLHMAWALSSSLLNSQAEPVKSRLGLTVDPNVLPLPIFVPLASFARYRRNLPGHSEAQQRTLTHFISHHLINKEAGFDLPIDFFQRLLKDGQNVILLLDGLDEVANEDERAEVRQSVEDLVCGRKEMRVVVTCRTIAYRNGRTALGANFREITVQPLDFDQHITPMVQQAYACIHPHDAARRNDRIGDLLQGITRLEKERRARQGADTHALIDSPLMVRLLLIVHVNNRTLPDERAELFDKAINALLQVDYGHEERDISELSTDWKLYRDMAQHLALHMHQKGRDQGREMEESSLQNVLREEPEFIPHIEGFLSHARQRGSVLEEREGVYRFIHLAFQEFLVARYLHVITGGAGRDAILTYLSERLDDPWWREPILLLVGYMATNAKPANEFLNLLMHSGTAPNTRFSAAELAGTAVLEWRESGETIRGKCARRIVSLLRDRDSVRQSRPTLRARAGDTLARLDDPRFDPQRHHLPADDLLGFVHIPADPHYRIGTRKEDMERVSKATGYEVDDFEINDDPTPTPPFYIARYPVTVAQFRTFVEAAKYSLKDQDALSDPGNRPVRWISQREAQAYCNWLNSELCHSPALDQSELARLVRDGGWRIALPSELEWERAARGGQGEAIFSWGDPPDPNRGNYNETGIKDTSTVGCFPANGFGLYDMSGNVWEWTRSLWGTGWKKPEFAYPYDPGNSQRENLDAGSEVRRVVRGGSWHDLRGDARCAYRSRIRPGGRSSNLGFRVVLRSPPVESLCTLVL